MRPKIPPATIDSRITEQKRQIRWREKGERTLRPSIPNGTKSVAEPSACLPKDDAAKDINSH